MVYSPYIGEDGTIKRTVTKWRKNAGVRMHRYDDGRGYETIGICDGAAIVKVHPNHPVFADRNIWPVLPTSEAPRMRYASTGEHYDNGPDFAIFDEEFQQAQEARLTKFRYVAYLKGEEKEGAIITVGSWAFCVSLEYIGLLAKTQDEMERFKYFAIPGKACVWVSQDGKHPDLIAMGLTVDSSVFRMFVPAETGSASEGVAAG